MSTPVSASLPAAPAPRMRLDALLLRAELIAPLVVFAGVAALAALTWLAWGDLAHDTGYDWVAAERISHGPLPYEDFPYWYGPLGVGLLAAAYEVAGVGLATTVAVGLALALLAVALTYVLARRLTDPWAGAVAALLTASAAFAAGNMSFVLPHSESAPVAAVALLLVVVCLSRYAASGGRVPLLAAGVAAGLTALARPEFALAAAAALVLWSAVTVARAPAGARLRTTGGMLWWTVPAVVVPAVAYGAILTRVPFGVLVHDNLAPRDLLDAGGRTVLRGSAPLTASSFAELAGRLALYAGLCAGLLGVAALIRRGGRVRLLVLAGLGVAALLASAALVLDPEAVRSRLHLLVAWIPAGALVAAGVLAWRARPGAGRRWDVAEQTALALATVLAVLGLKSYAAFVVTPNARTSQYALYAMPFAAAFLVWLHLRVLGRDAAARAVGLLWVGALCAACLTLAAIDGRSETGRVHAMRGTLAVPPAQAAAMQGAVDAIERGTRAGEPILLAPQLSALAGLTGRRQAAVPVSLLPGALSPSAERWTIGRLHDVRLAVTDPRPLREYGQGAFGTAYDTRLGAWLRANFTRTRLMAGPGLDTTTIDIWRRTKE